MLSNEELGFKIDLSGNTGFMFSSSPLFLKRTGGHLWQHSVWKSQEKVSFNIVSEAKQKFMQNAKNGQFWRVFEKLKFADKQCYQTMYTF